MKSDLDTLSPVDLLEPAVPLPSPLRWTSQVVAVAALTLALLNADAIRDWAYGLPTGEGSNRIVAGAEAWHERAGALGLNQPGERMRSWWRAIKDRRFGAQSSSEASASASPSRSALEKASSVAG